MFNKLKLVYLLSAIIHAGAAIACDGWFQGASWGSHINFANLPIADKLGNPATAIVIGARSNDVANNNLCKFTPGNGTSHFHNGDYDIYGYKEPSTLFKVCTIHVHDWTSGSLSTTNHYCIKALGYCYITGDNNGNDTLTFTNTPRAPILNAGPPQFSSAGNCNY